jgi:biotin carboxyl carrier protein
MKRRIRLRENGEEFWVTVQRDGDELTIQRDDQIYTVSVVEVQRLQESGGPATGQAGTSGLEGATGSAGGPASAPAAPPAASSALGTGSSRGSSAVASDAARASGTPPAGSGGARPSAGTTPAPMTGVIKEIIVAEGDSVQEGERVVLMEAMKMDIEVHARHAGTVTALHVAVGDSVREGQALIDVE